MRRKRLDGVEVPAVSEAKLLRIFSLQGRQLVRLTSPVEKSLSVGKSLAIPARTDFRAS
jgi:hypothetical protein